MRVLILGGTRFVGLGLAEALLAASHQVTTASRRPEKAPHGAEQIGGLRDELLAQLRGRSFDVVVDFICWDGDGPANVLASLNFSRYVLVSTVYMQLLSRQQGPGEPIHDPDWESLPNDRYREYLGQKLAAETSLLQQRVHGMPGTLIRLPVMWGDRDHSHRAGFYLSRLMDQQPIILVNGGENVAQIAWGTDVARAMATWISTDMPLSKPVWEALPDKGRSVREIVEGMATAVGASPELHSVSAARLTDEIPEYLEKEPLWRERFLGQSNSNLFDAVGVAPTDQLVWFSRLASAACGPEHRAMRSRELACLDSSSRQ